MLPEGDRRAVVEESGGDHVQNFTGPISKLLPI